MTLCEHISAAAKTNAASYVTKVPPEVDPARRILEQYSGIPPEDVDAHIYDIRDKAWAVLPYGCIGSFWFLNLAPTLEDPTFQAVAARLKAAGSTETFLDVGCCLGTAVRQLVADGVPGERLYGTDLQPLFLDLGYELFRDGDGDGDGEKSRATFLAGDMLGEDGDGLEALNERIDVIYASAFFHLFEREGQIKAAKRMVRFLNPENPGAMIFGRNEGPKIEGWERYVLDAESWRGMWNEVGEATGTSWRTEMESHGSDDWIRVRFAVYRAA